jgi:hypothetical protein
MEITKLNSGRNLLIGTLAISLYLAMAAVSAQAMGPIPSFRPPAVPLVTYDPYLNIWADCTHLAYHPTKDWARNVKNLVSVIRIDGKAFRLMGATPAYLPALHQKSVAVWPLRSIYRFAGHGIALKLTFMTPRLPNNLAACGRPVTYITWRVKATDGHSHSVQIYYSTSTAIVESKPGQKIVCSSRRRGSLLTLKAGLKHQYEFLSRPPNLSWGYIDTSAPAKQAGGTIGDETKLEAQFVSSGGLKAVSQSSLSPVSTTGVPVEAISMNLGKVGGKPVSRHVLVALDEQYCVNLNGTWLRPYWRHESPTASAMLSSAEAQYRSLRAECRTFDHKLWKSCAAVGGQKYAQLCALSYRESIGMMGMAEDANGKPLLFTDENTSGGDIATVDVIYPAAPMFLLLNPDLMKSMMVSVFQFCNKKYWPQPFAIHDLGAYPNAMGHIHGGGENMPVEESSNMILLTAAIAQAEGGRHGFADAHWALLTKWVHYLAKNGFDPGTQLCTDDFAGPMDHNANLSVKAINAIGAYAYLCTLRGQTARAAKYRAMAKQFVGRWEKADISSNGTHYRLGFTFRHSWSQKYNMIWSNVLGLHVFPRSVQHKELTYYMTKMQVFGLPLDSRKLYTEDPWNFFTASLDPGSVYFHRIMDGVYHFADQTRNRLGFADFYWTNNARCAGMYARPVMGSVFMTMLTNKKVWLKWAASGEKFTGNFSPLPNPPTWRAVVPAASQTTKPVLWHYTLVKPAAGWTQIKFDDANWKIAPAGFGTQDPGVTHKTSWTTDNIWLRRHFIMPPGHYPRLVVYCYHDQGIQLYINGVLAAKVRGYSTSYVPLPLTPAGKKALHPGRNVMAVHVHQTVGGQFFDLGLSREIGGGPMR